MYLEHLFDFHTLLCNYSKCPVYLSAMIGGGRTPAHVKTQEVWSSSSLLCCTGATLKNTEPEQTWSRHLWVIPNWLTWGAKWVCSVISVPMSERWLSLKFPSERRWARVHWEYYSSATVQWETDCLNGDTELLSPAGLLEPGAAVPARVKVCLQLSAFPSLQGVWVIYLELLLTLLLPMIFLHPC